MREAFHPGGHTGIFYVPAATVSRYPAVAYSSLAFSGRHQDNYQYFYSLTVHAMKGYLLKQQTIHIGQEVFIESNASENNFSAMFEDDGETGYFYAGEKDPSTGQLRILDMVHIYEVASIAEAEREASVCVIWSTDWLRCGLIINNYCHAVFDFVNQGGYNRNEFPPPNSFWTQHPRKLTDEMITHFFE